MPKQTFLHIGFPKTGTTSIQRFCSQHRTELAQNGYYYPFQPIRRAGSNVSMMLGIYHAAFLHHLLLRNRAKEMRYLESWNLRRSCEDLVEAFEKSGLDNLVLSAEGFSMLGDSLNYRKLRKLLRGHEITIVAYIRRLDDWHESMFQQEQLGWYESRTNKGADHYLSKHGTFSFFEKLSHFAKALPEARIIVHSLDDIRSSGGSLLPTFLENTGLTRESGRALQRLAAEFKLTNTSLSWQQFQLIHFVRTNAENSELLGALRQGINRHNARTSSADAKYLTFPQDTRERFLARYTKDVGEINQTFGAEIQEPSTAQRGIDAPAEITREMRIEWFSEVEDLVPNAGHRAQIKTLLLDAP